MATRRKKATRRTAVSVRAIPVTYSVPASMLREVQNAVRPHLHRLPAWVYSLKVTFDSDSDDPIGNGRSAVARVFSEVEYRRVTITLGPPWCDLQTDHERSEIMRHELTHPIVEPMADCMRMLEQAVKEKYPELGAQFAEMHRLAWEGVVCDLMERWP